MPQQGTHRDKLLQALRESYEATRDAIKSGNDRGYRFSRRLVNEVEQGRRELVQLGRRFARNPKDTRGLYQASVDLARRAGSHSTDLARQWVAEAGEAGQEVRETAGKVIRANRSATQAMAAAVQAAARDLARAARRPPPRRPPARKAPARKAATRRRPPRRAPARARRKTAQAQKS